MSVLTLWALAAVVLFLLQFALAGVQGIGRTRQKTFVRAEDAAWFGVEPAQAELGIVDRAQRAIHNNHENVPFFLAIGLAYALLECWPSGAWIYFPLFVLSRIGHNLCQLVPRQPLRNRMYVLGLTTLIAMSGHVVVKALAGIG
jgi:uncharacterized MAPEG superfamily protein